MAKVELKQPVVDEIKGVLEGAAGAVIVDDRSCKDISRIC